MLDGSIAAQILWGGAYETFKERPVIAKQLAVNVCQYMFQDRYEDIKVLKAITLGQIGFMMLRGMLLGWCWIVGSRKCG